MSFLNDNVRKLLESNPNVESITSKNIKYTFKFIQFALKKHDAGLSPKEIWHLAGFDTSVFKEGYCRKAIKRWVTKREEFGLESFKSESRGRRSDLKFNSLEEEVAYLRAENAFLKELQALEQKESEE